MHESIKLSVKIIISLACFIIVFYLVELDELVSLLKKIQPEVIISASLIMLLGHIGSGLRFHYIVNKLGRKLSKKEAIKVSFVALWFNQILPTGSGGDVVRGVFLAKRCGLIRTVLSVFLDRMLGLLWMVIMIIIFLPFVLIEKVEPAVIFLIVLGGVAILLIGLLPTLLKGSHCKKLSNKHIYRICRFTSILGSSTKRIFITNSVYKIFIFLCISFFPYVYYVLLIGNSFDLDITTIEYIALVPILFISMNFPISIGGWGVRELTSIVVFSYIGMPEEIALIISMLYGVGLLITSIPGNLFWVYKEKTA